MRKQVFVVEIATKERDGCGNSTRPVTAGEVRKALLKGLEEYDSIQVVNEWETA